MFPGISVIQNMMKYNYNKIITKPIYIIELSGLFDNKTNMMKEPRTS